MGIPIYMIVAKCQNNGIGFKGDLPWKLREEMNYFRRMTKGVKDPQKKNAVVMGRNTWDSIPDNKKPVPGRLNFVLSTQNLTLPGAVLCPSLDDFIKKIKSSEYSREIETVWVIGGVKVYEEFLRRNLCDRLYLTEVLKEFECDTFLNVDVNKGFKEVSDERVPKGILEENGIQYVYRVFEKTN